MALISHFPLWSVIHHEKCNKKSFSDQTCRFQSTGELQHDQEKTQDQQHILQELVRQNPELLEQLVHQSQQVEETPTTQEAPKMLDTNKGVFDEFTDREAIKAASENVIGMVNFDLTKSAAAADMTENNAGTI